MVNVTTQINIRRPVHEVADYASDPNNAPSWYKNIKAVEWSTPQPLTKGSKIAFKARFLGRELAYVYEIAELVPGQRLVMRTADGPFPMETVYTWEPLGDGSTRMTLANSGDPSGFSRLFAPFVSMAMRRANNKDLQSLKNILEDSSNSV